MVQRGNCSWAVDTYKMAVDTVARGAVEATGMQIQLIFTLIPDKICLLAYFLPVGLKAASDPFSAQIYLEFLGTLIPCTSWNTHLQLCLTKLSYNGMSSNPISLIATVLCITMHNILL